MSDLSNYFGAALLGWIKGEAMPSPPAAVYHALFNGDPAAGGVEVTGTLNLTRQPIAFGAIADRAMSNAQEIVFGVANGAGTATHIAVMDAATGGNVLLADAFAQPMPIVDGERVFAAAGDSVVSF